jgi:hypothetical protein
VVDDHGEHGVHDSLPVEEGRDQVAVPFVHHIVEEFAVHEDTHQFRAGLDLLLANWTGSP